MTLEEVLIEALGKVKATDILVYNMEGRSPFYSKMILASVNSDRQATAVISYVKDLCAENNYEIRTVEGQNTPWVLVDCYDVVLSVFTKEERDHFQLEKLYMEIPCTKVEE